MDRFLRLLTARTGLEWALYLTAPILLAVGLIRGDVVLLGRTGTVEASVGDRPWWYWVIMLFHTLCSLGLMVSLRARSRNKGRWFPER